MVTASAKTALSEMNTRLEGIEPTVGYSGFMADAVVLFSGAGLHECAFALVKDLPTEGVSWERLWAVLSDLMRETNEITSNTATTVISDNIETYARYHDACASHPGAAGKLASMKRRLNYRKYHEISNGNDHDILLAEQDVEKMEKLVKTLRAQISAGFYDDYFGIRFELRGAKVDLVMRGAHHRFIARKGKKCSAPCRTVWMALRMGK